ncbi:MAG: transporter substrate-binding domain-containing protein [Alphaproteobacteria bacterium]|nr:transporter substrate-binding domain-containing protein [Alphaproteobacteria bacterium]
MKPVVSILAAVAIALAAQNILFAQKSGSQESQQPAYDHVIKTNTLRCAYALYPPFISKDPNTGKLSGFMVDVMEELSKVTGINVDWATEIDFGAITTTLQSGKADAFCSGMAMTPARGRVLAASLPVSFGAIEAYVRKDDYRFDNAPEKINSTNIKLEVNEGDLSEQIAKRFFPKASLAYRGTLGGEDQLFLDVAMKKADVTFSGPSNLSLFNHDNPQKALRKVPFPRPLYLVSAVVSTDIKEVALINLINVSLQDMIDNGSLDALLKKNMGKDYGSAYLPPKPRI